MFELFKKIKSISPAEVSTELKKGTQLIDVREAHEFQNGHIKGARNIPLSKLGEHVLAKKQKVFINLSVGNAVKKAYKILNRANYDVTNVNGGMRAWRGKIKK